MNINPSQFLNETFDPDSFLNESFLSKIIVKDLSSLNFASIQQNINDFQESLNKLKLRFTEELETCILVNEINAETRQNEQTQVLQEYEDIQSLALELEYALTRSEEGSLHLENSLKFVENDKSHDTLTKELLETFLEINRGEGENLENFDFEKQALYLYILNKVVNNLNNANEYQKGINRIKIKFEVFKGKLMSDFKEAFWRYDTKKLRNLTHLLDKYGLLTEMSIFFIETSLQDVKSFKSIVDPKDFDFNCRFFLDTLESIIRAFNRLFEQRNDLMFNDNNKNTSSEFQIQEIFGEKTNEIMKQVFSYAFDNFLRKGIEFFLEPNKNDKSLYLRYMEFLMLNIKHFSSEILAIETPIKGQIRELILSYTNAIAEEIRNGYYEIETNNFQEKLDGNINKILFLFKNAEGSKKTKNLNNESSSKKKPFSLNSLIQDTIFHDNAPSKSTKKVSKNERIRKLNLLKDPLLQETMEQCFILLQESSRRCLLISQDLNKTLNVYGILEVFLNNFGLGLIDPLINYTEELIPGLNSSKYLDESFFEITSNLNVFIQRTDLVYQNCTKTLSLINESQEFLNKKENLIQRLTILLHKTIQSALASIFIYSNKILLEKQKKKDFCGENTTRSEACYEFLKHLRKYISVIQKFAFDKTRINILSSLGTQIISILTEHFTHYKVNSKGASSLLADLYEYSNFFSELGDENLKKEWESFLIIAKVLTISNEKIAEYVKEKGIENKEILQKYLKIKT